MVVRRREQIPPDAGGVNVEVIVCEVVLKRESRSYVVVVIRRDGDEVVVGDGGGDKVVGGVGENVGVARTGVDEVTEV